MPGKKKTKVDVLPGMKRPNGATLVISYVVTIKPDPGYGLDDPEVTREAIEEGLRGCGIDNAADINVSTGLVTFEYKDRL